MSNIIGQHRLISRAMRPWVLFGLLFAALILVTVYRGWPLLFPKAAATASLDPTCDLRSGPCRARFPGGGTVAFGIEPRTIPILQPLQLRVATDGLNAHAIEVDFSGTDMNMGFNRVALTAQGTGVYTGQGMLPVCVRARMGWEARVILHTAAGIWIAPFRFATERTGVRD